MYHQFPSVANRHLPVRTLLFRNDPRVLPRRWVGSPDAATRCPAEGDAVLPAMWPREFGRRRLGADATARDSRDSLSGLSNTPDDAPARAGNEGAKCQKPVEACVQEFERKQLLERIEREAATVGADIPDRITVQGEEIDLQEFVFEIRRRETVPASERDRVERAKKNLRRERLQRKQRIEDADISYEEGERLARSIIGIDRALNALEQLGGVDIEGEAQKKAAADRKRWMNFLRKALGNEDDDSGVGVGRGR
jgi:hypothetical protein